jgi:hypothetical protein
LRSDFELIDGGLQMIGGLGEKLPAIIEPEKTVDDLESLKVHQIRRSSSELAWN